MSRVIKPGGFGIELYITERGLLDFKILHKDKEGLRRSKAVCQILSPHLNAFEKELKTSQGQPSNDANAC